MEGNILSQSFSYTWIELRFDIDLSILLTAWEWHDSLVPAHVHIHEIKKDKQIDKH